MDNEILVIIKTLVDIIAEPVLLAIGGLLVYGVKKGIQYLQDKLDNECVSKYLEMAKETIVMCVMATNQNYVDSLKSNGAFDKEAWVTAFEKSKNNILKLLTDAQKKVISELYGDIDAWINTQIEATVRQLKLEANSQQPPSQVVNISQIPSETKIEEKADTNINMAE